MLNWPGGSKDENISFDGYTSNLILQIYQEILVNILTQNISETKINQNSEIL